MASIPVPSALNPNLTPLNTSKYKPSLKLTQCQHAKSLQDAKDPQSERLVYKSYLKQISSLCKDGHIGEAIDLLEEMDLKSIQIGPDIYGELLQGCVYERALPMGRQVHARIIKNGEFFSRNEYIETKLLVFYSKCDALDVSSVLFSGLRIKNVFSWAAIIGLYCRMGLYEEALVGHCEMLNGDIMADNFVIPNVLKSCGALMWIGYGRGVHGYVEKTGFRGCVFVASSLVDMYGKCGVLEDARKVFNYMIDRNAVAWNSMIVGYVQNGMNEEAIDLFYDIRAEGVELTRVTVASLLSASANIGAIEEGKQGHAISVLEGLELDNILGTSLMNFYAKVGLIEDAELVFENMIEKDMVTWNLLIIGYIQSGKVCKALNLCQLMKLEHLRFDSVTLASLLSASANECDIKLGKEAHCYCIRNNLEHDVAVASSIIKMYASCQRIDCAKRIFGYTIKRDLVMWNTMMAAYAEMGASGEAKKLFYEMELEGVPPNVISWNSLILGFLRNGQVHEAKDVFLQMQSYNIQPNLITWTTLISGLSQNGHHYEAVLNFQQMQQAGFIPNVVSIASVLSACTGMASLRFGRAIHGYVVRHDLLSAIHIATSLLDMYAKCGNLQEAERLFDTISVEELAPYNVMISGFALHGRADEAIALYRLIEEDGVEPDSVTFTNVLYACSQAGLLSEARDVFNDMVSKHIRPGMEHYGCIVDLLCRCGNFQEALMFTLSMPYEPDSYVLGSLLAACREQNEIELVEYFFKKLSDLELQGSGDYVALSNAYAAEGRWGEVAKLRGIMKDKGLRKNPGCSWVQIGGELHAFIAGDKSHKSIEEIQAILALMGMEMQSMGCIPVVCFNQ